jgi:hypothetical protein
VEVLVTFVRKPHLLIRCQGSARIGIPGRPGKLDPVSRCNTHFRQESPAARGFMQTAQTANDGSSGSDRVSTASSMFSLSSTSDST